MESLTQKVGCGRMCKEQKKNAILKDIMGKGSLKEQNQKKRMTQKYLQAKPQRKTQIEQKFQLEFFKEMKQEVFYSIIFNEMKRLEEKNENIVLEEKVGCN